MVEILVEAGGGQLGLPDPAAGASQSWFGRYLARGLDGFSASARGVLEEDARAIAERIGTSDSPVVWPATNVRTGIVVGAVQSGKTASMLAVSALQLDDGLDLLVVLAGTRVSLWKQTFERLLTQLDGSTPETASKNWRSRVLVPQPLALLRADRVDPTSYMSSSASKIRRAFEDGRPTILVIPKNERHLLAVSRALQSHFARLDQSRELPLRMLILDDEADDSSVLDAADSKTIPRRIEMLWTGNGHGETMHPLLQATYVAYTATPQANFLQVDHNPLAPRHFCAALRTPYSSGARLHREPTFTEPMGISRYYCGAEMYYFELGSTNAALVHSIPYPDPDCWPEIEHLCRVRTAADVLLMDGLRSFLVSAALRLLSGMQSGTLPYSAIQSGIEHDSATLLPQPHTMLIHPSAKLDLHAGEARRLVMLSAGMDPDHPDAPLLQTAELRLCVDGLRQQMATNADPWLRHLNAFSQSRSALELLPGAQALLRPTVRTWTEVEHCLNDEVIPNVRIRLINSAPGSDDRPRFSPVEDEDGTLRAPPDLLSIFVSGNVMSRGLTIDGLHCSVFTRPANEPAADTQMQMQRWFGYRGASIHLCRLFCFEDQLDLFRTYHEHDTALRREILAAMDGESEVSPVAVLAGSRSLATAKIPTTRLPLHPGPTPYIRLLETGDSAEGNARLLDDLVTAGVWHSVQPNSKVLGTIREEPVSLLELAALLDRLRYTHHDPDPKSGRQFTRWRSLKRQHAIATELFRPPGTDPKSPMVDVRGCPYSIAAYLRLWAEALERPHCDGLYGTHTERMPWAMVQPTLQAPKFYLGIRYGSLSGNRWESAGLLTGIRAMSRGAEVDADGVVRMTGSWGSRGKSGGYLGDQLFDYHHHTYAPPALHDDGPLWRPSGHPGLALFQVIQVDGCTLDAVTLGLALPHGGPEQFAAIPARLKR